MWKHAIIYIFLLFFFCCLDFPHFLPFPSLQLQCSLLSTWILNIRKFSGKKSVICRTIRRSFFVYITVQYSYACLYSSLWTSGESAGGSIRSPNDASSVHENILIFIKVCIYRIASNYNIFFKFILYFIIRHNTTQQHRSISIHRRSCAYTLKSVYSESIVKDFSCIIHMKI